MRTRATLCVLVAILLPLAIAPEAGSVPGAPTPHCSPGPESCTGWYTTNITISWSYDLAGVTGTVGCNVDTVTGDTAGKSESCQVNYGSDSYARSVSLKRDVTPPQVTGSTPERGPDSGGWYNRPVAVSFTGSDATSGLASCDRPTYGGGDGAAVQLTGTCRDVAGNVASSSSVALRYDATPPTVTAAPDRKPDGRGWFRRPVTVTFSGADATSGVSACTAPARYAGPDSDRAGVAGTCSDVAGNAAAELPVSFQYDATAPRLTGVKAEVARGVARVRWERPADAVLVEIARTPGVNGRRNTVVYRGTGKSFVDRTVKRGVRYRYAVSAADAAGNEAEQAVTASARAALYQPAAGATVKPPLRLAWDASAGARYYNVQLYRKGVKVLSTWPRATRFRVPKTWRYAGKPRSLVGGLYRWFVWPALGTRAQPRYGRPIGSSTFRVR